MCGHPQTTQLKSNKGFVSRYGNLFLCVLSFFCITFAAYLIYANIAFHDSQESIKQSYAQHIAKADSLYWDMISYNKDYVSYVSDVNAIILSDSLIQLTLDQKQRLSAEQYNRLHELLSTQFLEIERLHKKYDTKIRCDSLQLITERQVLEGQVKTMLDLHLNKIEHEYSNITLWAAVLTILFLVFSFYSIFKMDSLVHQGNEGVNEIRQLKRDGDAVIRDIRDIGKKILEENDSVMEKAKSDLAEFISNQQQIVSRSVSTMGGGFAQINQRYNDALNTKLEELNSYIAELQNLISKQKNTNKAKSKDRKEVKDEH